MVSEKVMQLCHSKVTLSSEYAADSSKAPGHILKEIFKGHLHSDTSHHAKKLEELKIADENDLLRAKECGNWGPTEPSELFLRVSWLGSILSGLF
jgi:hypothetical protein